MNTEHFNTSSDMLTPEEVASLMTGIDLPSEMILLERLKADIKELYHDRPSDYNHSQRTEFYYKVNEIIDKYIEESL